MTVHHILPEAEPFSEYFGGALSRWTANVLANDKSAVILAPWFDRTWNFDSERIRSSANLRRYRQLLSLCRNRVPSKLRRVLISFFLRTAFSQATAEDVVYVHNRPEFAAAIHAAYPQRRFKLILHMQNSHLLHHSREFARCADLTVFCSAFLLQEARQRVGEIRSTVIPNGADGSCFFPANLGGPPGPPTVLFVGRLIPIKGAHVLVEAMRILQQRGCAARALLVGSPAFGSHKDTPYLRGIKVSAPDNVAFSPYKTGDQLAGEFRRATVFCCPSIFEEPFGMTNVEAMASGLPTVAAEVGGIPEVFREGGALLVPPGDPEKLAAALEQVLGDHHLRSRLAREGRRSFRKNFTWQVVREKYREALESVAASESRSA
jgi:spore coat protein SA